MEENSKTQVKLLKFSNVDLLAIRPKLFTPTKWKVPILKGLQQVKSSFLPKNSPRQSGSQLINSTLYIPSSRLQPIRNLRPIQHSPSPQATDQKPHIVIQGTNNNQLQPRPPRSSTTSEPITSQKSPHTQRMGAALPIKSISASLLMVPKQDEEGIRTTDTKPQSRQKSLQRKSSVQRRRRKKSNTYVTQRVKHSFSIGRSAPLSLNNSNSNDEFHIESIRNKMTQFKEILDLDRSPKRNYIQQLEESYRGDQSICFGSMAEANIKVQAIPKCTCPTILFKGERMRIMNIFNQSSLPNTQVLRRKLPVLEPAFIAPKSRQHNENLIFIIFEGVLGDYYQRDIFSKKRKRLYLRTDTVQALKRLQPYFKLVIASGLSSKIFQKVLNFLQVNGVVFSAAYHIKHFKIPGHSDIYYKQATAFLDYSRLIRDFNLNDISGKILMLIPLDIDISELQEDHELFPQAGLYNRSFIRYAPPATTEYSSPPVIMLIPNPRMQQNKCIFSSNALCTLIEQLMIQSRKTLK